MLDSINTGKCCRWEFRCQNGQCISKIFVCDGSRDCVDGTDETHRQCQDKRCNEHQFQCHYGACIESSGQCDGKPQCWDGSDELDHVCVHSARNRSRRAVEASCAIPKQSPDKTVTYRCKSTSQNCQPKNGYVPEQTTAVVTCASGYIYESDKAYDDHLCYDTTWRPRFGNCVKICEKLKDANHDFECIRNRQIVDNCTANSILLAGTKVKFDCIVTHKFESNPRHFDITCNSDGTWNKHLIPCIAKCGIPAKNGPVQTTIAGGSQARWGDSPWHVAIFDKETQICGGTIIHELLVISAAHCFSAGVGSAVNVDNYEIAVSKYTRNYSNLDNPFQKMYKIRGIRFSESGYDGTINNHQADIAIIILAEKITISNFVLPACINEQELRNGKNPLDGELGNVVGWGRTENESNSVYLRTIDLPVIETQRCKSMVHEDVIPFITLDKFCAGTGNVTGPTVLQGDSGGGILFKENGLYYLRGVVSVMAANSYSLSLFTNIGSHIHLIVDIRDQVENNQFNFTISTVTTNRLNVSNAASVQPEPEPVPEVSQQGDSTESNLDKNSDNSIFQTLREPDSKLSRYPRVVAILKHNRRSNEQVEFCTGSLLTPSVVLTAAHCVKNTDQNLLKIRLYKYDQNGGIASNQSLHQERTAKQMITHSEYASNKESYFANDLALILVNESFSSLEAAELNTYYDHTTQNLSSPNSGCSVLGWGKTTEEGVTFGEATFPQKLKKIDVKFVPRSICEKNIRLRKNKPKFRLHQSVMCTNDTYIETSPCKNFDGAPLVCALDSDLNTFIQVGVLSWNTGCNAGGPVLYADLQAINGWFNSQLTNLLILASGLATRK